MIGYQRRTFLGSLAATGIAGSLAGCLGLGVIGDSHPNVTLSKPDREYSSDALPYRAWNERLPTVTIPAPLESRNWSLQKVDTPMLITFFYSHCKTICPVLISALRNVQTHAMNNGYGDTITILPITFDPARDDATRLRAYAKKRHVAYKANNWHFLRPSSEQRAKQIIQKQFGLTFEKTKQNDGNPGYMFTHQGLILLANADGYVERAYSGRDPPQQTIITDLKKLR